jgi:subtilisin family serine protease
MADRRDFFEKLVYETADRRRFTQESPVMPEVWIQYGMKPGEQQDLLMVPNWHYTPADLTGGIRGRLKSDEGKSGTARYRRVVKDVKPPFVVHNQNAVVATLWFDELVRCVLPLSEWWRHSIAGTSSRKDNDRLIPALRDKKQFVTDLVEAWSSVGESGLLNPDVLWLARVAGLLAYISTRQGRAQLTKAGREDEQVRFLKGLKEKNNHKKLATALIDLLEGIEPVYYGENYPLYTVNLNRKASLSLNDSVAAVKADASSRVFEVWGEGIRWAVIDSGIDARHVAFRRRNEDGAPRLQPFGRPRRRRKKDTENGRFTNDTRVVATYDFVHIRDLLGAGPDTVDQLSREWFPALQDPDKRTKLKAFLDEYDSGVIDWQVLMPILEVPHTPKGYRPPRHPHGTHVAGIIGADWRATDEDVGLPRPREDLAGVSPAIEMYDLRVLNKNGEGDEFAIMSAMQFVRALNNREDFVSIHGVNVSLSIPHDVANYACGRTPVCEEAERLVGNGIVVVAAAGNSGRARYLTPSDEIDDGFRTVSITDPGNAQSAITVGATHRRDPHSYGVSYFSSRGPTGDGRLKPDLVAPGEKIRSTMPDDRDDRLDGTSMAAPHVSGAAALLMSRHRELIGQPQKIKETLCRTATDLDREPYFQGAGLLDILRALQAI